MNEKETKIMVANVEMMNYEGRRAPWKGVGTNVEMARTATEALRIAGLDWDVLQEDVYTDAGEKVSGYKANVRSTDRKVLGVVTDRYKLVQNSDAFTWVDELLPAGLRYVSAGSFQDGKKVWLVARLPSEYIIDGERISPYLVFYNTHDGSGSVKIVISPLRILCSNMISLALKTASRSWTMGHVGDTENKMLQAQNTLFYAEK